MQKNGAGLQTASTCFWDNSTDGKIKLILIVFIDYKSIFITLLAQFHHYLCFSKQEAVQ